MNRLSALVTLLLLSASACGPTIPSTPTLITVTDAHDTAPAPSPSALEIPDTAVVPTQPPTETPEAIPEGLLQLSTDTEQDDFPAWSPDGRRITFASNNTGVYEVYVMNADGSAVTQLTVDDGTYLKDDPAWSPDGTQLAFAWHSDITRVYAFDVELAAVRPFDPMEPTAEGYPKALSNDYADAFSPAWSPDGRRIALVMFDPEGERQVFSLDLSSGKYSQITRGPSSGGKPSWSPDGSRIAFAADLQGASDIFLVGADGSGLTQLTTDPAYESDPSWSPDGRHIVFSSDRGGSSGLHVMRADGTYLFELNTGDGDAFNASWPPDGKYIAVVSNRDGDYNIYRINAPALEP